MKATGIVRHIDDLGRLVIPKELRRTMGIAEGDAMEIFVDGERIVLRKYAAGCVICGNIDTVSMTANQKPICQKCIDEIVKTDQLAKKV